MIEERPGGLMVSMPSGQPWRFDDPFVERGATIGYDPDAHANVLTAINHPHARGTRLIEPRTPTTDAEVRE